MATKKAPADRFRERLDGLSDATHTTDPVDRPQVMLMPALADAPLFHRDSQARPEKRLFDVVGSQGVSGEQ